MQAMELDNFGINSKQAAKLIINEVKKVVIGKDDIIEKVLIAILAKGHILLEDIPGVGKTTLAMAFSKATNLNYNRVQFTPDVMPSDITGFSMYKKSTEKFEFVKGAAMCNLFLADEINRTSSKTQAALLEIMEEGKVTIDLKTYELPKPFTVIATQNPTGHAGTQMLPESQLDRFLMKLSIGYPDKKSEINILKSKASDLKPLDKVKSVASEQTILEMQEMVEKIYVDDCLFSYSVELISKTRNHELIELGASPRGTIALINISKAKAFLEGRDYVIPKDIQTSFYDAISHRIILKSRAKISNYTVKEILEDIITTTRAPQLSRNY